MDTWDSSAVISTFISLDQITAAEEAAAAHEAAGIGSGMTPVLALLADARAQGYRSACLPLTTDKWRARWAETCLLPPNTEALSPELDPSADRRAELWRSNPAFDLGEVTMTRLDEADRIIVMVSDWLELDAEDAWVREDYEIALHQELAYASYLNVHTVILPPPRNRNHVTSYARAVNACLRALPFLHLSIRLPIYDPLELHSRVVASKRNSTRMLSMWPTWAIKPLSAGGGPPRLMIPQDPPSQMDAVFFSRELNATWEMWDLIRTICDYDPRLSLALDLTMPLPSNLGILRKWSAEAVQFILLPASTFIENAKGYPVLPKSTQAFVQESMTHRPTVILSGVKLGLHRSGGESAYAEYVRHLERTSATMQAVQTPGTVEQFAQGYQDYLQAPLQPLMDNLQAVTYHTFEQDPVKYQQYEEAVYHAIVDRPSTDRLVICVAGAGRGPLVTRCLQALDKAHRTGVVYAIEKNPNAWATLQNKCRLEWGTRVETLLGDMRHIDVPEQADILVSELLGSFGDNELSPECLDGAMRFLKPDGLSIPCSYTAYLAPLSSSKLYNEARYAKDKKGLETPYVVMFQAVNILSGNGEGRRNCGGQIQECWEFEHPRKNPAIDAQGLSTTNSHNTRSANLRFHIPHAGVLHGLAGYFEAVLYDRIGLSIHPHRKHQISRNMLSWFPIFFPFREPLYLPNDSELQVSIWRRTNKQRVWYEWHAESFLVVGNYSRGSSLGGSNSDTAMGDGSTAGIPFPLNVAPPSPLVDAVDSPITRRKDSLRLKEVVDGTPVDDRVIKIGQTGLHNPDGRSSWIGL